MLQPTTRFILSPTSCFELNYYDNSFKNKVFFYHCRTVESLWVFQSFGCRKRNGVMPYGSTFHGHGQHEDGDGRGHQKDGRR